jgi:hypothetical protein
VTFALHRQANFFWGARDGGDESISILAKGWLPSFHLFHSCERGLKNSDQNQGEPLNDKTLTCSFR